MDPPTRPRNPQQEITPEEWSRHSDTIKTLFLTDGKSLSAVKSIMETDHDFRATYVGHFSSSFPFYTNEH